MPRTRAVNELAARAVPPVTPRFASLTATGTEFSPRSHLPKRCRSIAYRTSQIAVSNFHSLSR
jgi:hypothetical protein